MTRHTRSRWPSCGRLLGGLLLLAVAPSAAAQGPSEPPPAPVDGAWIIRLHLPVGDASPAITFETDGDDVSGVYSGRYGHFPITGRRLGRVVTFTFQMGSDERPVIICFTGEWNEADGTLGGTATLGELGQGTWTAERDPQQADGRAPATPPAPPHLRSEGAPPPTPPGA